MRPTILKRMFSAGAASPGSLGTCVRSFLSVPVRGEQVNSELLTFPKAVRATHSAKLNVTVFIVPGNPGLIDYYGTFMEKLQQNTNGNIEICGLTHAGHASGVYNGGRLFTLDDQIDHKEAFLRQLIGANPSIRLVLTGHSIGAYICVELMRRLPPQNILSLWGLYPTLQHIGSSPNGLALTPIFRFRPIVATAAGVFSYLPTFIKARAIQYFNHMEWESSEITANRLMDYSVVNNSFFMAHDEMHSVHFPDIDTITTNANKCVFYFAPEDKWAPEAHYEDIARRVPEARVLMCGQNTRHAFCVFKDESEHVADLSTDWLAEALKGETSESVKATS